MALAAPDSTYSGHAFFAILLSVITSFGGEDENTPVLLKNAQEDREQAHCGSDFQISFLQVDDDFKDVAMGYVS